MALAAAPDRSTGRAVTIGFLRILAIVNIETYGGADTVAGARARLHNLGYIALKDAARVDAPADALLERGLDRFRFANGIVNRDGFPEGPVEAPFDAKMKDRLEDVHDRLGPLSE